MIEAQMVGESTALHKCVTNAMAHPPLTGVMTVKLRVACVWCNLTECCSILGTASQSLLSSVRVVMHTAAVHLSLKPRDMMSTVRGTRSEERNVGMVGIAGPTSPEAALIYTRSEIAMEALHKWMV